MINTGKYDHEYVKITKLIELYIDSARSGHGDAMKSAFHPDATIFGYAGAAMFAGPIQQFFTWNRENGPAAGLEAQVASIDLVDRVATVRLELENWTGLRFTDFFTLFKTDDVWQITNKVFHLHA